MKKDIATMKHSGPMKNSDCQMTIGSRNVSLKIEACRAAEAAAGDGVESVMASSNGMSRPGHGMGDGNRRPPFRHGFAQAFLYSDQKSFQSSSVCCTGMFR